MLFKGAAFAIASLATLAISTAVQAASSSKHRLTAYVVDWALPVSIHWDMLDHVHYAFAIPDSDGNLSGFDSSQLKSVVKEAHTHEKGISLSVGGWTGSLHFSGLVRTASKREAFADVLVETCKQYDLDGLDIDWEYPNDPNGVSCNEKDENDTPNFLEFLKVLRKKLDATFKNERKWISASVGATVFKGSNQESLSKLDSEWGTVLDAFQIMCYDLTGYWAEKTGANAPLRGGSADSSVEQAVEAWHSAGIPYDRIVVGVPFYGYTGLTTKPVTKHAMQVPINHSKPQIKGDKYDTEEADPCPGAKASYSGEFQWRAIQEEGILHNKNGWKSYWDASTETPYAYNAAKKQFVTFDDPHSLSAKAKYAKELNLQGIMLWSLDMDDSRHSLLKALQDIRA
ncbi:hypothetical protein VTP01DRAFT_4762 [Rhizomucor pusillus]|uniref:uncharacterized protein n=1 Tax=Rhizomucor pusillus TaxID=4840 RepID=UPI003742F2B2